MASHSVSTLHLAAHNFVYAMTATARISEFAYVFTPTLCRDGIGERCCGSEGIGNRRVRPAPAAIGLPTDGEVVSQLSMRISLIAMAAALVAVLSGTCAAMSDVELERLIAREIAPMANEAGGAAVAVRMDGRTILFNYGWAERASKRPITSDSLFNIASLRKVFEATLLAEAVRLGELSLSDRAADYVTELREGEHISRVTLVARVVDYDANF